MMRTRLVRSVGIALAGFAAGMALVVACGDNDVVAVPDSSAAECECAPAEPPLDGRIERFTVEVPIGVQGGSFGAAAYCGGAPGRPGTLLGGGCHMKNSIVQGIFLRNAGALENSPRFVCTAENVSAGDNPDEFLVATAICLIPPE